MDHFLKSGVTGTELYHRRVCVQVRHALAEDERIDNLLLLRDLWEGGHPSGTSAHQETLYDLRQQAAHALVGIVSVTWSSAAMLPPRDGSSLNVWPFIKH
eukprot:1117837-Prorocentrum_minimum.AAC.3